MRSPHWWPCRTRTCSGILSAGPPPRRSSSVPSSRAYAVSSLELPAVTAAARAGGVLVVAATAFVVWCCFRSEVHFGFTAAAALAGGLVLAGLRNGWHRARRSPARHLEARPDGSIWLRETGAAEAFAVTVERGTRLLGPSVF